VFLVELITQVEKIITNMMQARNKRKNENFHLISLHVIALPNINIQKANNQDTNFNQNAIKMNPIPSKTKWVCTTLQIKTSKWNKKTFIKTNQM